MKYVFFNVKGFNYDISDWDILNVIIMYGMFKGVLNFNKLFIIKLINWNNKLYRVWNVVNVIDMSYMF